MDADSIQEAVGASLGQVRRWRRAGVPCRSERGIMATSTRRSRWMATGHARCSDALEAGRDATAAALAGPDPRLLVVFSSQAYDLPRLLEGIRSCAGPDVPLIGCSTAGEIATAGPGASSLVVTAIGGEGFSVTTGSATNASGRLREASAEAAACARDNVDRPHQVLMILTDGLGGDQQEVVRGAYAAVGAEVPLVGGCAGDDLRMQHTFQLCGSEVLEDAVVCASLTSDAPIGIGVQHGWQPVGEPFVVTASASNRVYALDGQPALDVYLERLRPPPDVAGDAGAFTRFALTHPLGISRRNGVEVRFIAEAHFADRSLGCIAEVPAGGLAWIMEGDEESVLAATDGACTSALAALNGAAPVGLLAFDCIARRGVLGEEGISAEVKRIAQHAGGAPVAGFYTYGEIARVRGINGFHNQTLVVLALA